MAEENKPQKRKMSKLNLYELEQIAKEIEGYEDPEMKRIAKEELQAFANDLKQEYDLPADDMLSFMDNIPGAALTALDWVPGMLRTAAGEATIAARNYKKGLPQETDVMLENAKKAINPFDGEFAIGGDEINKRLGVKESDASLADTKIGQQLGVPKDAWYDVSANTAKATPWDLIDPAVLLSGLKSLARTGGKKTAAQLEKELAKEVAKNSRGGLRRATEFAGEMLVDPGKALGDAAIEGPFGRFANANKATRAKGLRNFSDVYAENETLMDKMNPFSGITSEGIQNRVEQGVNNLSETKMDVLRANPNAPNATLTQVMEPLNSREFQEKSMTFGDTGAYNEARSNVRRELVETANARNWQELVQDPIFQLMKPEEKAAALAALAPHTPVSTLDLERLARSAQDKASAARVYAKPTMHGVKNMSDLKMIPSVMAEGDLQAQVGMRARDLQSGLLDAVNPGAGGEVFQANKDLSSLLTGAPFVDRGFSRTGNASSRANNWLSAMPGRGLRIAGDAIAATKDVGSMVGGKAARSPWMRFAVIPETRAQMIEAEEERRANDPWTLLQQYFPRE